MHFQLFCQLCVMDAWFFLLILLNGKYETFAKICKNITLYRFYYFTYTGITQKRNFWVHKFVLVYLIIVLDRLADKVCLSIDVTEISLYLLLT